MSRPELVDYVHALAEGATREGWIAALEAMKGRPDSMLVLRQAGVRALVMVGELDRLAPIAEAMSIRSLLKGDLVVVPNVVNMPETATQVTLLVIALAIIITPAAMIAHVRKAELMAERRMHLQAWHLRQLVPDRARGSLAPLPIEYEPAACLITGRPARQDDGDQPG